MTRFFLPHVRNICLGLVSLAFLASGALAQGPVSVIGTVTPGDCVAFNSTTIIKDAGVTCGSGGGGSPGGINGSIQFNNSGSFGGFTMGGDCTVNTATGIEICTKTNGTVFGTFATANSATPPAIGGTTPAAGSFSSLTDTGISGSTQCVQANSSGVLSGTGLGCSGRTFLAAATTFHVSFNTGSDSNTCLTGSPGRSFNYCYSLVQQKYDTGGNTITFLSDDTTSAYPDCFLASGNLFGQPPGNWGLVLVNANGSTFGGPTAHAGAGGCTGGNPYLVGANFGAAFTLKNTKMNNTGSWNVGTNLFDMVNIGNGSNIAVDSTDTVGSNQGQGADFDVNGILTILSGYGINKPAFVTTGNWSIGGSTITVGSASGLQNGMGVGTAIGPNNCFIASIVGTTVTVSADVNAIGATCSFTTNGSATPITFTAGAVAHWDVGAGGQIQCANNGIVNLVVIPSFGGTPFYFQGFATANVALSQINCAAVWFQFGTTGPMFNINAGSNIYTAGAGVGYFPGNFDNAHTINVTGGSATATLSGAATQYDVIGAEISDNLQATNCTTTSGSGVISGCTAGGNCVAGATVVNTANVPNGSTVASSTATSVTLATGQAAQSNGSGVTVTCTGHFIANGTLIANISGTTVTLDRPALNTATAMPVGVGGLVLQQGHGGGIF